MYPSSSAGVMVKKRYRIKSEFKLFHMKVLKRFNGTSSDPFREKGGGGGKLKVIIRIRKQVESIPASVPNHTTRY